MSYISIVENGEKRYFEIPAGKMSVFGREEHVDFQILEDSMISREHFGIEADEDGRHMLIDLGASNGTFLNGRRIEANSIRALKDRDSIGAGRMIFVFELNPPPKEKPLDPIAQVSSDLKKGKGFKTLMSEIVAPRNSAQGKK